MSKELNIFSNPVYDFEFLGFSFNGRHSSEFGLTVVSPSGMSQDNMFASFEDKAIEVTGKDGSYYFGTIIKTKSLSIQLAYDNLTSADYRNILNWLNPKTPPKKLIFDERPYKYYIAKVSQQPSFTYVPFESEIEGRKTHIFKGELLITFIANDPYAYCDTNVLRDIEVWNGSEYIKPYIYGNIPGWFLESGLIDDEDDNIVLTKNDSSLDTSSVGIIKKNLKNANFYNCGVTDYYPKITFTIDAFQKIDLPFFIKNVQTNEIFEIASLKNIPQLDIEEFSVWTIVCEPSKGLVYVLVDDLPFNIGLVHNGTFLKLIPGENNFYISSEITNFSIEYKQIYW